MPKVSIVITCYNYARYLPDAVGSALSQTYRDLEVIIVNDGSTDETAEVARRLVDEHPDSNIRLIDQHNQGLPSARNNGIAAAAGEYVLPLDADDMLHPAFLEKLVPVLDANPSVGLVYAWSEKFGDETGILRHGAFTLRNLIVRDGPPQSPLFRKSAWEEVGGYNPVMDKGGEDWEFGLSLFRAGYRGVVVPEVLFSYRRHGRSMIDDMVDDHAIYSSYRLKLLHTWAFEPRFFKVSPTLARAVVHIKRYTRDPLARVVYLHFPGLHRLLRRLKHGPDDGV